MTFWRYAVSCAAVLSAPAAGQSTEITQDTQALLPPYRNCVMAKALELEPSDEPAAVIVSAAITSCVEARKNLRTSLDVDFAMADAASGRQSPLYRTRDALQELDRRLEGELRLKLLEKRARRKSN